MTIFSPIFQLRYKWAFGPDTGSIQGDGGWYAAFNVASAFSNAGLSLLDTSLVTLQGAYGWIFTLSFLILAGNTAFPIFLRIIIWALSKCTPKSSRSSETLQFLLDHPRRCFIYLFPAHQTWILVVMLLVLNCTDWVSFLVLDIGNPVINAIPTGRRVADGLLQAFAVRAAGFSIVPLSATAPALQVLYVVMMCAKECQSDTLPLLIECRILSGTSMCTLLHFLLGPLMYMRRNQCKLPTYSPDGNDFYHTHKQGRLSR